MKNKADFEEIKETKKRGLIAGYEPNRISLYIMLQIRVVGFIKSKAYEQIFPALFETTLLRIILRTKKGEEFISQGQIQSFIRIIFRVMSHPVGQVFILSRPILT